MSDLHIVSMGDVVVWVREGSPEFGIVEGRGRDVVFVRRLDGSRAARARLLPKPADSLAVVATGDDLKAWLVDRARTALRE